MMDEIMAITEKLDHDTLEWRLVRVACHGSSGWRPVRGSSCPYETVSAVLGDITGARVV